MRSQNYCGLFSGIQRTKISEDKSQADVLIFKIKKKFFFKKKDNSMMIARGKGVWGEKEEGKGEINGHRRLDFGW